MIGHRLRTLAHIHAKRKPIADVQCAFFHHDVVQRLTMRCLMHLVHFCFARCAADDAAVADLPATLRIEARRIKDDAALICDLFAFNAVFEQRDDLAFAAELFIADKSRRALEVHQIRGLAPHRVEIAARCPRTLLLQFHLFIKCFLMIEKIITHSWIECSKD